MATTRLGAGLLALGLVLLLGLQNLSPRLPLVFLGGRTVALPVGLWLVLAILLGGLTTLALNALVGLPHRGKSSPNRYKYEPQPFYEPANPSEPNRPNGADRRQEVRRPADFAARSTSTDSSWRDWTDLQSPTQWNSWEDHRRPTPEPQRPPAGPPPRSPNPSPYRSPLSWFGRRPADGPDPRVQDSLREIANDWDDIDPRSYRPSGVSPVEESLEEITEGWDDLDAQGAPSPPENAPQPPRDYDAPKPPTQVYRDGSIYSYSYRDRAEAGQTDRIYVPPDDAYARGYDYDDDPYDEPYDAPYNNDAYDSDAYGDEDPDSPDLEDEGVVDADFRVIIPPPPADPTEEKT